MGIHRGFPALSQDAVRIASNGRVSIAANVLSRLNAQFERLTAGAPPGAGARVFRPHEHSVDGGAILGRGTIYSLDVGNLAHGSLFSHALAATGAWESMVSANREYAFPAFVSPGLTGSLSCQLIVRTYGAAVDIRVSNLDTGTTSSAATSLAVTPAQTLSITDIPMTAGQYNRFDLEIKATLVATLDLLGLCLYEDTATHPASPGTTTYSAL